MGKVDCSNSYCPQVASAVHGDPADPHVQTLLRASLKFDKAEMSKDEAGLYWCTSEDCQHRCALMNYGHRIQWAEIVICPGDGLPPTEELWRTAMMVSRKEVIDVYYSHLIGSAEEDL